jgi:voltage-gated potassium channel Kch
MWSLGCLVVEGGGCLILLWLEQGVPSHKLDIISAVLIVYAYSRINEIAYAFYSDSLTQSKESDLKPLERIRMAMRSYWGLAFNFAILFYFLPLSGLFKEPLANFFESLYFSVVTMTTLGYGDVLPHHWLARLLVMYEVITGIILIAVAIATYIGGINEADATFTTSD